MGLFRVTARLIGPTGVSEQTELLVDTGATFLTLPRSLANRLGVEPQRQVPVVTAGGTRAEYPVGEARVVIDGREVTTPCFIAPSGPALLGAVALESLLLGVDPAGRRLVPIEGVV